MFPRSIVQRACFQQSYQTKLTPSPMLQAVETSRKTDINPMGMYPADMDARAWQSENSEKYVASTKPVEDPYQSAKSRKSNVGSSIPSHVPTPLMKPSTAAFRGSQPSRDLRTKPFEVQRDFDGEDGDCQEDEDINTPVTLLRSNTASSRNLPLPLPPPPPSLPPVEADEGPIAGIPSASQGPVPLYYAWPAPSHPGNN